MQETKKFDIKKELVVIGKLTKLLSGPLEPTTREDVLSRDSVAVMDGANVCMVIGKSVEAKNSMVRFVEKDYKHKVPELDYKAVGGNIIESKYSNEYLKRILDILCVTGESTLIKINRDYPSTFENDHFKIILAPRVSND